MEKQKSSDIKGTVIPMKKLHVTILKKKNKQVEQMSQGEDAQVN